MIFQVISEPSPKSLSWWRRQLITVDIIFLGDGRFLCCCCYSFLLGIETLFPIQKKQWGKIYIWVLVTAWIQKSPCVRWTTCTLVVDLLVMVIHTWTVCCVTLLSIVASTCNFARSCCCCVYREEERSGLLVYDWTWTKLVFVWSYHSFSFLCLFEVFLYHPYSIDSTVDRNTLT